MSLNIKPLMPLEHPEVTPSSEQLTPAAGDHSRSEVNRKYNEDRLLRYFAESKTKGAISGPKKNKKKKDWYRRLNTYG